MSHLEMAMATLIQTFDQYAGSDGKKSTLSKAEVKTLVEKELPGLLQVRCSPAEGCLCIFSPPPKNFFPQEFFFHGSFFF
uniref:S100/CaBP-9k-type calcium binding subdomain domain-containing protein n=1 Tax=Poecilia mexicana TaxID=48701 RepID=A0A3B3WKJ1_9TELE